jgi:16S rRNA (guanine527-N7)-methyltransferase
MENDPVVPLVAPASFIEAAAGVSLVFDDGDLERFGLYLALLERANRLFNLTGITEPEAMWHKHILDSLTLMPVLSELPDASHIADVGSGAGLPGIPLAIAMPMMRFTLMESTAKKAKFIEIAAAELGLKNVRVECERVETLAHMRRAHREQYAAAVARAVGHLAVLLELTVPLLMPSGRAVLTKGQKAEQELAEAAEAMRQVGAEHVGTVPTPTGTILVFEKVRPTPRTLPRRPGEPARAPIGLATFKRAQEKGEAGAEVEGEAQDAPPTV